MEPLFRRDTYPVTPRLSSRPFEMAKLLVVKDAFGKPTWLILAVGCANLLGRTEQT